MNKRKWISVIAAFWSAAAIALSGEFVEANGLLRTLNSELNGIRLDKLIVLAALVAFYYKVWDRFVEESKWITHLLAAFFSVCMLIGISYSTQGSWVFFMGNRKQMVIAFLTFAGYFILFDVTLSIFYGWLSRLNLYQIRAKKPLPLFAQKHSHLWAFLVIYLCWLPWIIVFFPGSVPADGYRQLDMYFGGEKFTTRHAWVLTMFVGLLMSIGRLINDNMGVFLIILVTSLLECYCYSGVCSRLKKWKAPKQLYVGSVLFFGLMPMFGTYAQTVIKDSMFSAVFALYMALYAECAIPALQKRSGKRLSSQLIQLAIVGILTCFCRNNGIYMVFVSMVFLIFFVAKRQRLVVLALAIAVFGCYSVSEKAVAPALGISSISSRVYFSIPFQQTARYVRSYPEDVTEEEKDAINQILNYDQLAQRYNPELSDPVKATYRTGNITKEKLMNYFKAWFSMFKKHPGVYIEATLHNTYGYFYPFYHNTAQGPYRLYNKTFTEYQFEYDYVFPNEARSVMAQYAYLWRNVPGFAQISNSGAYTWMLLILAGYLFYRKRGKGVLALAAPALNVAICVASPVNGMFRYVLPLIACMPVVVYWCIGYGEKEFTDKSEESR